MARENLGPPGVVTIRDRNPDLGTLVPEFPAGAPVQRLEFTGRGLLMVLGADDVTASGAVRRRKVVEELPFRGFVRSFWYAFYAVNVDVSVVPIVSTDPRTLPSFMPAGPIAEDRPLMVATGGSASTLPGLGSLSFGGLQVAPLNSLLGRKERYLGVHLWNASGATVPFACWFEVLEVIERGG